MGTPHLDRLGLFVAVAETASFSGAARRLGLPKSTVSRGIAALESELGVRLLHRTTRHVALSTAGAALKERVAPLLAAIARSIGDLPEREEQPSGQLRVATTADFGALVVADIVAGFVGRYPGVEVELHLGNAPVDLVARGIDVALRISTRSFADSSLVARRLAPIALQVFGAPRYLALRGAPRTPADLAGHEWVVLRGIPRLRLSGPGVQAWLAPRGRVTCDDMSFVHQAVRAGAGLGILPTFLAGADVAAGHLTRVLSRWIVPGGHVWMVTPSRRQTPRKVTAFGEAVVEGLRGKV